MSKYTTSLFESIKDAINKNSNTSTESSFKDFMKLEIDKTYVVRLIPLVSNPERTFFHYFSHIWKSVSTNNIVSVLCPNTYGEKCPIDEYRSKIYSTKDDAQIEKIRPIKRNENWRVNVLVVKDPTNPENQGKVKILRYGKQLAKIIDAAITGDESDEFGAKVFDLSENGCNLKIKVEKNEGGYASYTGSKFTSPSKIDDLNDIDEAYNQANDLDAIFDHKSYDEIKKLLNTHFLGEITQENTQSVEDVQENFDSYAEIVSTASNGTVVTRSASVEESEEDKKMQEILNDL
jgi:hypothetical protein